MNLERTGFTSEDELREFVLGWWDQLMKHGSSGEAAIDILKDLGLNKFLTERPEDCDKA